MLTLNKRLASSRLQGVVCQAPQAAEEVQLVVLNSLGETISTSRKLAVAAGPVVLDLEPGLRDAAQDGFAFALVKGITKGNLVWERRLGRLSL